ncbi:MAG: SDR family oxidoreductase [Nitrososphaerota archaeon]|jgi:NAD(P)-dependent dehydrogenase (short-subunit alcohol dehydrogenase family)|nr:SDR family oxidoreductase [Nitrososphaerota archaeon]MDG6932808.1 SDR family oxidoreductase [Nitrososphaerota archaeon]MDG6935309.1 SDR family oxidoreductase [Nitrososphaerota archaeon]MDG6944226.1 SDR family oxidoreductase [Nitrososphaerota archaeon]
MKIKGTAVLITGSAVRLGRHMAMHLAARGSGTIIIHYNKSEKDAYTLKENLERVGVAAQVMRGDLSTADGIKSFLNECSKACGTIDILINSASDFLAAPMLNYNIANYTPSIVVNGLAPHALIVWAHKNAGLKKAINILDASPRLYAKERYGYYLGKSLLEKVTERLAIELAPDACVNAIAPGYILPPAGIPANNSRVLNIPLKRRGKISELNMALDFLIENDYITGQIIYVDGGAHLMSDRIDR